MADTPIEERIVVREWRTFMGGMTTAEIIDNETEWITTFDAVVEHNAVVRELRAALAGEATVKSLLELALADTRLAAALAREAQLQRQLRAASTGFNAVYGSGLEEMGRAERERTRADAAEAEVARLREALRYHGSHDRGCPGGTYCTCGYTEALAPKEQKNG